MVANAEELSRLEIELIDARERLLLLESSLKYTPAALEELQVKSLATAKERLTFVSITRIETR